MGEIRQPGCESVVGRDIRASKVTGYKERWFREPTRIKPEPRPNFGTILQRCTVVAVSRPSQRPTKKTVPMQHVAEMRGQQACVERGQTFRVVGEKRRPRPGPRLARAEVDGRVRVGRSHAHYGSRAHPHRRPGLRLGESSIRNRDMRHQAVVGLSPFESAPICPSPRTYAGVNKGQSH